MLHGIVYNHTAKALRLGVTIYQLTTVGETLALK
jgi:hypothetical protein